MWQCQIGDLCLFNANPRRLFTVSRVLIVLTTSVAAGLLLSLLLA